jgi:hypothetical protein
MVGPYFFQEPNAFLFPFLFQLFDVTEVVLIIQKIIYPNLAFFKNESAQN